MRWESLAHGGEPLISVVIFAPKAFFGYSFRNIQYIYVHLCSDGKKYMFNSNKSSNINMVRQNEKRKRKEIGAQQARDTWIQENKVENGRRKEVRTDQRMRNIFYIFILF